MKRRSAARSTGERAPARPIIMWSDEMVADDVLDVLVRIGFTAEQSRYAGILAVASDGRAWEMQIEAVRSPSSLSVALMAVSDNWASEPSFVEAVGGQLLRAARVYAAARGTEVFVAPVPRW
jgi:hypothetical protein